MAPVRDSTGAERVLKVGWRHPEAEHEVEGLRTWAGDGAVRVNADETTAGTSVVAAGAAAGRGTPLTALPEPSRTR